VRCVRKGGAVTLVGNVAPQVALPLQVVVTRELTLSAHAPRRANIRLPGHDGAPGDDPRPC